MEHTPYREAVGALNYLAVATRPDLAHAVGQCARFSANPGPAHWRAVKRIMAYAKATKGHRLMLGGTDEVEDEQGLTGYTDADGMSNVDRHAISGYAFMLFGRAVSWASKRQEIIALSTTEAEYVGATHAAKEALWMRSFIGQIFAPFSRPTVLHSDNQSAIALAKDDMYRARTKHIDIRFHFIRWVVKEGKLTLVYCPTGDMVADIFTKPLHSPRVKHLAHELGVRQA